MRKRKLGFKEKSVFFIVAFIILAIVAYTVSGVVEQRSSYMRFGIDIKGGVSATFRAVQNDDEEFVPTDEQLDAAKAVIELRMDNKNILDRTVSIDSEHKTILVEFPWQADEKEYDPVAAIEEFGETALLTFVVVESADADDEGAISHEENGIVDYYTIKEKIMDGSVIESASSQYYEGQQVSGQHIVALDFDSEGTTAFANATDKIANVSDTFIGIMLDDILFSVASVREAITDGNAMITSSSFDATTSKELADKINSGALPFAMESTNYSSVSATMGSHALKIMLLAGAIALGIIILFMCSYYRLPGFVASITLLLQTAGQLLIFHSMNLTLTLPGIAGIILSIGMGVDSNIIIAERIKEELRGGKTIRGSISAGYSRAFSAVLDCNITTAAIGILLMIFGSGAMLSFAYTLLIGILLNFGLSIIASKLMLESLASYKFLSKSVLYGYKAPKEVQ